MRKLDRDFTLLKTEYEVDDRETRIRGYREASDPTNGKKPDRAASQPSRQALVLVPSLDLTKVKGYE